MFQDIAERNEKSEAYKKQSSPPELTLPYNYKWVSHWKRPVVEDVFKIYYNYDFSGTPADIFNRLSFTENLTQEQLLYIETIKKYLDISVGYGELSEMYVAAVLGDKLAVETKLNESLTRLDSEKEEHIRYRVYKFLCSVIDLLEALKLCRNSSDAYEGHATLLFSAFAELCCLNVRMGMLDAKHSTWKNLYGIDKVISKPDICLYKHGVLTKSSIDRKRVVSVVKVKKSRDKRDEDTSDSDEEFSKSTSSIASFGSDSSENVPKIELLLNKAVLGQHAGELLLELYKFGKNDSSDELYKMPGVIVKGTMVFVTLLEISKEHYMKLTRNTLLKESDKAFIYYSRPFNVLKENDRNILIESFVMLNNLQ